MLSQDTITALEETKQSIQDYLDQRTGEIDDLVKNLRAYGVPLDSLSVNTTEAATSDALATIDDLLG